MRVLPVTALATVLVAAPLSLVGVVGAASSAGAAETPSLRLFSTSTDVTEVHRPAGERTWFPLPAYVEPVGGTFDLRVRRVDFDSPITVTQAVHAEDGSVTEVPVDLDLDSWRGLPDFLETTLTDRSGEVVKRTVQTWCPNGWGLQRRDPDGVDESTFPDGCGGMPFMVGHRWGIDDGWAGTTGRPLVAKVPAGRYRVRVAVAQEYRDLFGIADEDAVVTARYRVRNGDYDEHFRGGHDAAARRTTSRAAADPMEAAPRRAVPEVADPDAELLPDLRTLPAFGIRASSTRNGRDWLSFGANVWVGGDALLDIEGFRRDGEDVMDAWQYFYAGDQAVGRARVGEMEYDTRDGHFHWHLLQFARYRLLDAQQQHVTRSKKQSFCIVPTDPVDLSLEGAEMAPYETGLDSACGDREALWIRETLPLGWGDTYYQGKGGQAFDITNVPNGTYFIAVEANPTGELFEQSYDNNTTLRKVRLKGRPGDRTVCVPGHGALGLFPEGRC